MSAGFSTVSKISPVKPIISIYFLYIYTWVELWGFLWWAPSAKRKGHHEWSSTLDGAVLDIAQILVYLVHNISRSQLYLGFGHFGWLLFSVNNIWPGLWLSCISSVEITLFLLADILLQHRALFQCKGLVKSFSPMICQVNGALTFYMSVFRWDVLWYGAVRPSVRLFVRPSDC